MRTLTFTTFLRRTVEELSEANSAALFRIVKELEYNPRLLEPTCLYIAYSTEQKKKECLLEKSPALQKEFVKNKFLNLPQKDLEMQLQNLLPTNGYYKLWHSYCSVRDRKQADNHTKALMHQKIRKLQEEKGVSNYCIYTTLHLNPGNINAFLKNRDCSKVGLTTARKVLRYLQQC